MNNRILFFADFMKKRKSSMPEFRLPTDAAKFVSLQRLETQALGGTIHYTTLGAAAYKIYEMVPLARQVYRYYSINIEPRLRSKSIIDNYCRIMSREFATIRDYIPSDLNTIIGIGPGVAGLEVLISKHCRSLGNPPPSIILIDKTGIDPVHFGFHEVAAVYNSLDISRNVLVMNGHPPDKVSAIDAEDAADLRGSHVGKIDLVTSLIAWGFHFPIDTYLDLVESLLRPGGCLIVDVRRGTDGRAKVEQKFGSITIIMDDPKFERILAVKP